MGTIAALQTALPGFSPAPVMTAELEGEGLGPEVAAVAATGR